MAKGKLQLIVWLMPVLVFCQTAEGRESALTNQTRTLRVEKVEPPNWWANHTINPVRLLVRGANFQNARVKSPDNSLKVSNLRVNSRGDYVFFDVEIAANAKIGKYEFELSNASGAAAIPFEISRSLDAKTNFQTITNDDVIYLIMTDRFSNGDAANDKELSINSRI
jgi:neopullulanase